MPHLEIRKRDGSLERRELDPRGQLTIGASPAADVRLDSEGILPIECRITGVKGEFVLATNNPAGTRLNGEVVQKIRLREPAVVRIADVEIHFREQAVPAAGKTGGTGDEVRLKLDSEPEVPSYMLVEEGPDSRKPAPPGNRERERPGGSAERGSRESRSQRGREEDSDSGTGGDRNERGDRSERGQRGERERGRDSERSGAARRIPLGDDSLVDEPLDIPLSRDESARSSPKERLDDRTARALAEVETGEKRHRPMLTRGGPDAGTAPAQAGPSLKERLKSLKGTPRRPGEQSLYQSRLVVGLSIGMLALALIAGTLWFVLGRQHMNRRFDTAKQQLEGGQFTQAIEGFLSFAADYPKTPMAKEALVNVGRARVGNSLNGAIPDWEAGLKTLTDFVNEYRDSEDFRPADGPLRQFALQAADRIAVGAAETAKTTRKRSLLGVSTDARSLLELHTLEDKPAERLAAIASSYKAAESAILQQETYDATISTMEGAIKAGTPLAALSAYGTLLDRYPNAPSDKLIQSQLQAALEADRAALTRLPEGAPAEGNPSPKRLSVATLGLTRRVRARTDVTSVGTTTAALSEGTMFAVDTVTGDPLFRRGVGADSPFAPVLVQSSAAGWLVYDEARRELICLAERTGEPIWQTPLPDRPTGPPLVYEGQVYLTTAAPALVQCDLQTGTLATRLAVSQPLVGPPAVSGDGSRLYVPGRESVLYVLTRRPLAAEKVVWLGHAAGSIQAPLLMLRDYLMLVENGGNEKSQVRLLDTSRDPKQPRLIATSEMPGPVTSVPIVRGKQVVIASPPERVTAFVIAETGDAQSLTRIATYQVPAPQATPMHLLLGPDDQFWMCSTALRRFDIKVDSIVPDKEQVAVGISSQPLSVAGDALFLGRRTPYSRAVLLANADRQKMVLDWQTVLGSQVLEITDPAGPEQGALAVTATGDVFQINESKLTAGGFELQPTTILPIDEKATVPVQAARQADGRIAVWSGGEAARMWIVSNEAAPRESRLEFPLQSPPARLADGLVLPLPGLLRLLPRNSTVAAAQDWTAPVQNGPVAGWRGTATIDETSLAALLSDGRLLQVQLRKSPQPHLAEVTSWDLGAAVELPLAVAGERAIVTGVNGRVVALALRSLEPQGEYTLARPATRPAVVVGTRVLLDEDRQRLVCLDAAEGLKPLWQLPLEGATVVGAAELGGEWLLARTDGVLQRVDPATGKVAAEGRLYEQLTYGPKLWKNRLLLGTRDGALLSLPLAEGRVELSGAAP